MSDRDVTDEDFSDPDSDDDAGDVVAAGIAQFQKAALDALRAARTMLDAAEAIVTDPKAIESVISTVSGVARDVTQTVAGFAAGAGRGSGDDMPSDDDGFESIEVN